MPKRKLGNGERRLAGQSHQSAPEIPEIYRLETPARQPNPRECRRFSHSQKSHGGDRTGWLGMKDSNWRMSVSKFATANGAHSIVEEYVCHDWRRVNAV
jgi:hypothetical protein